MMTLCRYTNETPPQWKCHTEIIGSGSDRDIVTVLLPFYALSGFTGASSEHGLNGLLIYLLSNNILYMFPYQLRCYFH